VVGRRLCHGVIVGRRAEVATVFSSQLRSQAMALRIDLGVAELAATRFAISPLSETVASLQQLCDQDRQAINLRWLRWAADDSPRSHWTSPTPGR
jgi:hypothetical protein